MKNLQLLLPAVALCALTAQANVINFDDLTFSDYDPVPAGYKSNDAAGGTPNISVGFQTVANNSSRTVLTSDIELWHSGYGDLSKVGFASSNGYLGDVILTPDAGYEVTLNSFDLGGWPGSTQPRQTVRILDGNGNILLDYSPLDVTGTGHNHLTPGLTSTGPLIIEFGPSWNTGIDNIDFTQSVASTGVPDGGATGLMLLGSLAVFGAVARKKS